MKFKCNAKKMLQHKQPPHNFKKHRYKGKDESKIVLMKQLSFKWQLYTDMNVEKMMWKQIQKKEIYNSLEKAIITVIIQNMRAKFRFTTFRTQKYNDCLLITLKML